MVRAHLSRLIGRPTASIQDAVSEALAVITPADQSSAADRRRWTTPNCARRRGVAACVAASATTWQRGPRDCRRRERRRSNTAQRSGCSSPGLEHADRDAPERSVSGGRGRHVADHILIAQLLADRIVDRRQFACRPRGEQLPARFACQSLDACADSDDARSRVAAFTARSSGEPHDVDRHVRGDPMSSSVRIEMSRARAADILRSERRTMNGSARG